MDIQKKLDELGRAFEEFKKTNDAAIVEIKTKGQEKGETKEKLEKIETNLQSLETKIGEFNAALTRIGQDGNQDEKVDKKMGQYKDAVIQYMRKGTEIPADLQDYARKALTVDSEVGGGFFVEPEVSSEIVKLVHESSPLRQLASVQTISGASLKINSDLDRPAATPVGERAARSTTTSPTVKQIEIFAHEYYVFPEASQSFLDDAAVNVEAWLADWAGTGFALTEATDFISGDANNRIRGILSYADGSAFGQIQRLPTDATGAITGDDLLELQDLVKEPYQRGSTWLMNRLTKTVIRKVKNGTEYLWQPGLQQGAPDVLLGRPVALATDLNTSLATGTDGLVMYGDFKAGYQIVDRMGIRVLRDNITNKPYVGFYTTKRVGGAVKNYEAIKVLKIL